ncbi:MAG: hypothetical protein FD181_3390 [Prolixibacteraceae bacterium]|nr:MAG: hypothetical protein FD181_3390 [Prolixibacteraceae bacterium]
MQNVLKSTMKASEKIDYRFKDEQPFRSDYSFYENNFRVHKVKNQNFIVPWQMIGNNKTEVIVK